MFTCSVCAQLLSHVRFCVTLWTVAHLAPLSMGLPRQEYWSELPISFSWRSSWPRDQIHVSCIVATFFTTEPAGKPQSCSQYSLNCPFNGWRICIHSWHFFTCDIVTLWHLISQILLEVYHSFLMTFWRISILFQCFNLFSVLNFITLCSYLCGSFFPLNLGLFCPFSSFWRKKLRLLIWFRSSFLMQAFSAAICSSQNGFSCTPHILMLYFCFHLVQSHFYFLWDFLSDLWIV